MLRTLLATHPVVKALLPAGSRRRAAAARAVTRVWPAPQRRPTAVRPPRLRAEETKLQRVWAGYRQDMLGRYLVSGYQDPRINVQSILARHTLVRALFGSEFDSLMREDLARAVELNEAIRIRAAELGITLRVTMNPDRQADVERVTEVIADRVPEFGRRWRDALADRQAPRLSVLEYACGSANDYGAFADYGLARFLDYTGVDLNETNIANARRKFPGVDFRVGSVLSLPEADRSVDYVIGFDIMEHLSLPAMKHAMDTAVRICRRGLYFAFFLMDEVPEHIDRPVRKYHRNLLSAPQVREAMRHHFGTVQLIRIADMLQDTYGYTHSHTSRAYSLIAENRKPVTSGAHMK
ncbi:MAG: class I SAM-dependent methyltransferase [Actinobacteria bacterium]|nr:class I SAM-dependent methyltransferase [Actinomycetota bacterium]